MGYGGEFAPNPPSETSSFCQERMVGGGFPPPIALHRRRRSETNHHGGLSLRVAQECGRRGSSWAGSLPEAGEPANGPPHSLIMLTEHPAPGENYPFLIRGA
jgi:hypothetical protein